MLAFCAKMKNDATKVTIELKRTVNIIERQENVIFELRHLIEDKLARVFIFSETMDENLSLTQYKTESGFDLDFANPVKLKTNLDFFELYSSQVQGLNRLTKMRTVNFEVENKKLMRQNDELHSQITVIKDLSEKFAMEETKMRHRMQKQEAHIFRLERQLAEARSEIIRQQQMHEQQLKDMEDQYSKWKQDFLKMNALEIKVAEEIYQKLKETVFALKEELRNVLNILRVPRMTDKYRKEMLKAANDDEELVNAFNEQQLAAKGGKSIEEYEEEIINEVIKLQLGKGGKISDNLRQLQDLQQKLDNQRQKNEQGRNDESHLVTQKTGADQTKYSRSFATQLDHKYGPEALKIEKWEHNVTDNDLEGPFFKNCFDDPTRVKSHDNLGKALILTTGPSQVRTTNNADSPTYKGGFHAPKVQANRRNENFNADLLNLTQSLP